VANIKSAKKRIAVTEKKSIENQALETKMKTLIKKYKTAIAAGNVEAAEKMLPETVSFIDSLVTKGIVKKNYANGKKADLAKALDNLKKNGVKVIETKNKKSSAPKPAAVKKEAAPAPVLKEKAEKKDAAEKKVEKKAVKAEKAEKKAEKKTEKKETKAAEKAKK